MTGKELIMYILQNGLEDEPVFKNGEFIGFVSEMEFAKRMNVGVATVQTWIRMGIVDAVKIGKVRYIPANQLTSPLIELYRKWGEECNGSCVGART